MFAIRFADSHAGALRPSTLFFFFSNTFNLAWHWTGGEVKRKVGIVGKGLTFDSGGYNLKVGGRSCGKIVVTGGQGSDWPNVASGAQA